MGGPGHRVSYDNISTWYHRGYEVRGCTEFWRSSYIQDGVVTRNGQTCVVPLKPGCCHRINIIRILLYSQYRTPSSKTSNMKGIRRFTEKKTFGTSYTEVVYCITVERTHSQRRNPAWTSFPVMSVSVRGIVIDWSRLAKFKAVLWPWYGSRALYLAYGTH